MATPTLIRELFTLNSESSPSQRATISTNDMNVTQVSTGNERADLKYLRVEANENSLRGSEDLET